MAIANCGKVTCVSSYQDKIYGKNMRVFNEVKNENRAMETLRCTVCGNEISRTRKSVEPDEDKRKGKGKKPTSEQIAKDLKDDKEVPVRERKK